MAPAGAEAVRSDESDDLRWFDWDDLPVGTSPTVARMITAARAGSAGERLGGRLRRGAGADRHLAGTDGGRRRGRSRRRAGHPRRRRATLLPGVGDQAAERPGRAGGRRGRRGGPGRPGRRAVAAGRHAAPPARARLGLAPERRLRSFAPGLRRVYSNVGIELAADLVAAAVGIAVQRLLRRPRWPRWGWRPPTLPGSRPATAGPPSRDLAVVAQQSIRPMPAAADPAAPHHDHRCDPHRAVPGPARCAPRLRRAGPQRLGPGVRDPRVEVAALDGHVELDGDVRALRPERDLPLGRPGGRTGADRSDRPRLRRVGPPGLARAGRRRAGRAQPPDAARCVGAVRAR